MTPRLAAFNTIHDYPGGSIALAPQMGVSASYLRSAVNPNSPEFSLSLERVDKLMSLTGDKRILQALADNQGCAVVELPKFEISDVAVLESYTTVIGELGEFSTAFNQSLSDGKITRNEFERMRVEMNQAVAAALSLIGRIEQLVD